MTAHSLKQQGYLMIDHRFSPGLPEDVALMVGMDPKLAGEGKLFEADTLTCAHCKCAVMKNPMRQRARENCPKCGNHYICDLCALEMRQPDYDHTPFEAKIEAVVKEMLLGSPTKLLMP